MHVHMLKGTPQAHPCTCMGMGMPAYVCPCPRRGHTAWTCTQAEVLRALYTGELCDYVQCRSCLTESSTTAPFEDLNLVSAATTKHQVASTEHQVAGGEWCTE